MVLKRNENDINKKKWPVNYDPLFFTVAGTLAYVSLGLMIYND